MYKLLRLLDKPRTVGLLKFLKKERAVFELERKLECQYSVFFRDVATLEEVGIIKSDKIGKFRTYLLDEVRLEEIKAAIAELRKVVYR